MLLLSVLVACIFLQEFIHLISVANSWRAVVYSICAFSQCLWVDDAGPSFLMLPICALSLYPDQSSYECIVLLTFFFPGNQFWHDNFHYFLWFFFSFISVPVFVIFFLLVTLSLLCPFVFLPC